MSNTQAMAYSVGEKVEVYVPILPRRGASQWTQATVIDAVCPSGSFWQYDVYVDDGMLLRGLRASELRAAEAADVLPGCAEVRAAAQINERQVEAYRAAFLDTWIGAGDFWPARDWAKPDADAPRFLNGQERVLFAAVRRACAGIGLSDAERWNIVATAIACEASKYADFVASAEDHEQQEAAA